jgi:hypothetical protein
MTYDELPFTRDPGRRSDDVLAAAPRKARPHRHTWERHADGRQLCSSCGKERDMAAARRGRNNRKRGNAASLDAARRFGGRQVEGLQLPWDTEGVEWVSQVKSHTGAAPSWTTQAPAVRITDGVPPLVWVWTGYPLHGHLAKAPARWAGIFDAMDAAPGTRRRRLIERWAPAGRPARWAIVVRSDQPVLAFPAHQRTLQLVRYELWPGDAWLSSFGPDAAPD